MKGHIKFSIALAGAVLVSAGLTSNAGVLDILKGEPANPQRVAFVGSAEVKSVSGQVMRLTGIDRWTELSQNITLQPGDVIRTHNGTALLRMNESSSFINVTPNTVLRLVPIDESWDRGTLSGREEKDGFVIRSCRGNASAQRNGPNGPWQPVEVNTVLARGTDLRTSPGAILDLFDTQRKQTVRILGATRLTLTEDLVSRRVRTAPSLASSSR